MPYNDPDPGDPMKLVGIGLPGCPEAMTDMAYTVAEEFARLEYSEEALMALFQNPFYRSAHAAYQTLGDEAIRRIVQECVKVWGRSFQVNREATG